MKCDVITSVADCESPSAHCSRSLASCCAELESPLRLVNNSWFFLAICSHSGVPGSVSPASANAISRGSASREASESSREASGDPG